MIDPKTGENLKWASLSEQEWDAVMALDLNDTDRKALKVLRARERRTTWGDAIWCSDMECHHSIVRINDAFRKAGLVWRVGSDTPPPKEGQKWNGMIFCIWKVVNK